MIFLAPFRIIHAAGGDQRFDHICVVVGAWTLQGAWDQLAPTAISDEPIAVGAIYVIGAVMWVAGFFAPALQIRKVAMPKMGAPVDS